MRSPTKIRSRASLLPVALALAPGVAHGQDAPLVPIQGTLTDADGTPRSGVFSVRVQLYDLPMGGTPLYEEIQPEVAFDAAGVFSLFVGAVEALPADFFHTHPTIYVALQIDGEPFLDRLLVGTVPYASQAAFADSAERAGEAAGVEEGALDGSELADGAVGRAAIGAGAVGPEELAGGSVGSAQLADGAVDGPKIADTVFTLEPTLSITRGNTAGSNGNDLGPANRRLCFLSRVEFEDIDGNLERAQCSVAVVDGRWVVRARLSLNSDARASCSASCVTW